MNHNYVRLPSLHISSVLVTILLSSTTAIAFQATGKQGVQTPGPPVSFQRDIRPLISNICSACHGPDEKARKANLRLDTQVGLLKTVIPGKPEQSPLYLRLKQTGPGKMPPATFLRQPTPQQVELVAKWISRGAKWEQHWAYAPLVKPPTPALSPDKLLKSEIDRFIVTRLKREGLALSLPADRRILLRRLSFDLTGLPPTFDDVQAFTSDRSADAYEKAVDRLLASERYGERMAVVWLDLVRYADTRGYHGDQNQEVSPYRDYVIKSFNDNKPFDVFTREQLAGDLLPKPGIDQKVASGYNKLLMTTEEGGSQAKEYLAKYAADRVRNVSAVWLGSTMGCCQCHDHKYDPFTIRDFYSMAAFFADVKQTPVGGLDVTLLPTAEQSAGSAELGAQIAAAQKILDTQTAQLDVAQGEWELNPTPTPVPSAAISAIRAIEQSKRSDKQRNELSAYFRTITPLLAEPRAERMRLQQELDNLNSHIRKSMITTTVAPATVRILPRGNWLDESGDVVTPALPSFLDQLETPGQRASRLDLANWICSRRNPLTARVMVNRIWAMLFGRGLSRSMEDFGAQGAPPTHPQLLDWLASDYIDHGWDTKRLIREIVLSATYRQSSVPSSALLKRDPNNDLFGRQGRKRLDAEFVRDNALAVSGLLVLELGGSSVKPYQPSHYWDYLNFPMRTWIADKAPEQYRRGLYTYWCRTYLQPSLLAFDAPTREECCSSRVVSNTPQQALVLLNDPTYVEAARALAERIVESTTTPFARVQTAFHLALQRDASQKEVETLLRVYQRQYTELQAKPTEANDLAHVGDLAMKPGSSSAEVAAWTSVTRVILNLHEVMTRN